MTGRDDGQVQQEGATTRGGGTGQRKHDSREARRVTPRPQRRDAPAPAESLSRGQQGAPAGPASAPGPGLTHGGPVRVPAEVGAYVRRWCSLSAAAWRSSAAIVRSVAAARRSVAADSCWLSAAPCLTLSGLAVDRR